MKKISTLAGLMNHYPFFKVVNNSLYFENQNIARGSLQIHLEDDDTLCIYAEGGSWSLVLASTEISGTFYYDFLTKEEYFYPFFELNIEVVNKKMDMVAVRRNWYINSLKDEA